MRWLAAALLLLLAGIVGVLLWRGAVLLAAGWVLAGALLMQGMAGARRSSAVACLGLAADGSLFLLRRSGEREPVQLGRESLHLGNSLLLVLGSRSRRGPRGGYRLLLGPWNVNPSALAALRRQLGTRQRRHRPMPA